MVTDSPSKPYLLTLRDDPSLRQLTDEDISPWSYIDNPKPKLYIEYEFSRKIFTKEMRQAKTSRIRIMH